MIKYKGWSIGNFTSHDINVYRIEDVYEDKEKRKLIAKEGSMPYLYIPKDGMLMAYLGESSPSVKDVLFSGMKTFKAVDPLPGIFDFYVVSFQYLSACRELGMDTSKLAVINGGVYNTELKQVGCISLSIS